MLNFFIFLIVLCAVFYFFKSLFSIAWWIISFVWNIIKPLGFLLFLIAVVIWFLKTFVY